MLTQAAKITARRLPPLNGAESCNPGDAITYPRLVVTMRQRGFTIFTRPAFPLPAVPRVTRDLLRLLPRAPYPHGQDPRTHAGAGTGFKH